MTDSVASEARRHAATYHAFMLGVKWCAIHLGAVIVMLTMWFATPAGFWCGVAAALGVVAVGVYAMNHGLAHSTADADIPGEPPTHAST